MAIIFSVDPALQATGIVVYNVHDDEIIHAETIRTEKANKKQKLRVADDDADRISGIARRMNQLYKEYMPKMVIFEIPHGGALSARAARSMGMITGLMMTLITTWNVPYEIYSPADCKKACTGFKDAAKEDIEKVVVARWPKAYLGDAKCYREHMVDSCSVIIVAEQKSSMMKMLKE